MSDNDQKIQDFKNCTGIENTEKAKRYLVDAEWDLVEAIRLATPDETQKLPSEVISDDVAMEEVPNKPSVSNMVSVDDDYLGPSTSNSRIKFNIYNETLDSLHSVVLSGNESVARLKEAIRQKWGTPPCQQMITGWVNIDPAKDDVTLKSLNLPSTVQLSVYTGESPKGENKSVNGVAENSIPNDDGKYTLKIYDEVHSKDYKLILPASKTVAEVKEEMFHRSDIPINQQIWVGWPSSCTSDDQTLGQLELVKPIHDLSFRSAPVLVSSNSRRKRNTRISSSRDSDSDTSFSSNEDEDMHSVIADDLFEEDFSSKSCICSLVPPDFENETTGCLQFAISFQEKYGVIHPDFFPGTLDQAFKEACFKPAKDRKLLAVYLHHSKSILTNVFCSQLLCDESVLHFLSEHFIVWGWDVTLDNNKSFLLHTMQTVLGREASHTVRNTKTDKYPLILVITRVRRNTEILTVIHGDVCANELMSQLIQVADMFSDQQVIECKEEEERAAREMIKVEQDEAYQQSLEVDRAKLEAKRKQEQLEIEEQAKIENARIKEAEKKEAHRRLLESKLPPEPEDGVQGITRIRVRVQENQFLERKFLKTDPIELLLNFLVVKGYDISEYNLITNFPRRDLTTMKKTSTFEELKLFPQETLILEER